MTTTDTDMIKYFNTVIDDYGEEMTLRHVTGVQPKEDSNYDDIYQQVNMVNMNTKILHSYTDYTVKGMIQSVDLSTREHRKRHTVIGYGDQDKKVCYMKKEDTSGTAINSRELSPNNYNLDENDEIIVNTMRYSIDYVKDWRIKGNLIYYELIIKIKIDKMVISDG